jgi:hypothetical protein
MSMQHLWSHCREENGIVQCKVRHAVTLSSAEPVWKNLASNLALLDDRPSNDGLSPVVTYDSHLNFTAINCYKQNLQSVSVELFKEISVLIVRMTQDT